jgi:hypothetical protein
MVLVDYIGIFLHVAILLSTYYRFMNACILPFLVLYLTSNLFFNYIIIYTMWYYIRYMVYIFYRNKCLCCIVIVCEHGLRIVICCALSNKELLLLYYIKLKGDVTWNYLSGVVTQLISLSCQVFVYSEQVRTLWTRCKLVILNVFI